MEDRAALLFGTGNFSLADISHRNFCTKLTHMLNQKTFYEVSVEHMWTGYDTRPPALEAAKDMKSCRVTSKMRHPLAMIGRMT